MGGTARHDTVNKQQRIVSPSSLRSSHTLIAHARSILDGTHGFDPGIPPLYGYKGNEEALVLYHEGSEPTDSNDPFGACKDVDVVVTKRNALGHCLVLMEHYKAGYVSRFMRVGRTGKMGLR